MEVVNSETWRKFSQAAYGNPWLPNHPRICIVAVRYGGAYEGGLFVAMPEEDLNSAAFDGDVEAAEWWGENRRRVGVGTTPNDALREYFEKHQPDLCACCL